MRFSEYATRILALLQEDGMGKVKTSTGTWKPSVCHFVCCCVATAVPPKQQRRQ